jgi:pSer/pThr/pTyr-binding forkhead associated (FHA) protein
VINDKRVSRNHCEIVIQDGVVFVRDLSSQNGVRINQTDYKQKTLADGDVLQIGNTDYVFETLEQAQLPMADGSVDPGVQGTDAQGLPSAATSSNSGGRVRFYAIVAVIGLLAAWLLTSDPIVEEESQIKYTSDIEEAIETSETNYSELQRQKAATGRSNPIFVDAQALYIKGFRDYREGNYRRALESFSAALAIFPKHELARKYLQLSQRRLDETVQIYMMDGKRYMEQGQFRRALAAYERVTQLITDRSNMVYKEAYARKKELEEITEGAF